MKVYTTGEVSKLCNVSTATVNKWFDTGQLPGYRVPGSKHRRIPHENLVRFLKLHNAPLGALADNVNTNVLVVTRDRQFLAQLQADLPADEGFSIIVAADGFSVGLLVDEVQPQCVVVDFTIGEGAAASICATLRRRLESRTQIIAVTSAQTLVGSWASNIDETFRRPFDPSLLVQRIRSLAVAEGAQQQQYAVAQTSDR